MEFLTSNVTAMDCMVVAIYNSLISKGIFVDFAKIKLVCIENGWYSDSHGFKNEFLQTALERFGVKTNKIKKVVKIEKLSKKIKKGKNSILIMKPTHYYMCHASFAMKGKKGIKTYNTWSCGTGWKTLFREFKEKEFTMFELEIL